MWSAVVPHSYSFLQVSTGEDQKVSGTDSAGITVYESVSLNFLHFLLSNKLVIRINRAFPHYKRHRSEHYLIILCTFFIFIFSIKLELYSTKGDERQGSDLSSFKIMKM